MHYTNLKEVSAVLRVGHCDHGLCFSVCDSCCKDMADLLDKAITLMQQKRQLEAIQGITASIEIIDKELNNLG